jgi:hypothetical protein
MRDMPEFAAKRFKVASIEEARIVDPAPLASVKCPVISERLFPANSR